MGYVCYITYMSMSCVYAYMATLSMYHSAHQCGSQYCSVLRHDQPPALTHALALVPLRDK